MRLTLYPHSLDNPSSPSPPSPHPTPHSHPSLPQVGTYDPFPQHLDGVKEVRLRVDRIKYWLAVGAQPSDRVAYLLWRAGLAPPPPIRWQTEANVNKKVLREAAKKGFHTLAGAAGEGSGSGAAGAAAGAGPARVSRPSGGSRVGGRGMGAFAGVLTRPAGPLQLR